MNCEVAGGYKDNQLVAKSDLSQGTIKLTIRVTGRSFASTLNIRGSIGGKSVNESLNTNNNPSKSWEFPNENRQVDLLFSGYYQGSPTEHSKLGYCDPRSFMKTLTKSEYVVVEVIPN